MKKLAIVFAVGTAALIAGSTANADNAVKSKPATSVATQSGTATQSSTDISARHRHHHWRHHHGHRHYRPHYNSYGYYAPRPYGYGPRYGYHGPRYYGGGPGVTFSFGGGRGWY